MIRLLLLAVTTSLAPVTTAVHPTSACEILTAAEIAKTIGAPAVKIDSINSGLNDMTKVDFCSWYVTEGQPEGLMVKLRRSSTPADAPVAMIAARVEEDFPSGKPETIPGIGQEAQYLPYPDGKGGTIIVRQGVDVVTLVGSATKAALIAAAKLLVPRL